MPRLILASTSPRRREILALTGLSFEVVPSSYEEDMTLSLKPEELARTLAYGKAAAVAALYPDAVVIGADTFVALDSQVLGKPHTPAEAESMLHSLSGRAHRILTGYAVIDTESGKTINAVEEATVHFRELTPAEITGYVATGEPLDKAGAYAIQGLGGVFIDRVEGEFFAIIGLPLNRLVQDLRQFGLEVFP